MNDIQTRIDNRIKLIAVISIILFFAVMFLFFVGCSVVDPVVANEKTDDIVENIGATVGTFVPGPFGMIITGVSGLLAGLIRARQNKLKAVRIVKAIEEAKIAGGGIINFTKPENGVKEALESMGQPAKALVDRVQDNKIIGV